MEKQHSSKGIQRDSFSSISAKVEDSLAWLESTVPSIRGTRFGAYARSVKQLAAKHAADEKDALTNDFETYANALLEANELVTITNYLRRAELCSARELIKKIAGGPVQYLKEDPAKVTNAPRNFATELQLAAKLHGAGLVPVLPNAEDVRTRYRGRNIYFECKRPFTIDSVDKNLAKAASQLTSRYTRQNSLERGIVLCDLSRAANPEFGLLPVRDNDELDKAMNNEIDKVIAECVHTLAEIKHEKTIGVVFRLACLAVIEDKMLLTYGSQYTFMALQSRSLRDQSIVRHLAGHLEGSGGINYFHDLNEK